VLAAGCYFYLAIAAVDDPRRPRDPTWRRRAGAAATPPHDDDEICRLPATRAGCGRSPQARDVPVEVTTTVLAPV